MVLEGPPPASSARTAVNAWRLNCAGTPSCQLSEWEEEKQQQQTFEYLLKRSQSFRQHCVEQPQVSLHQIKILPCPPLYLTHFLTHFFLEFYVCSLVNHSVTPLLSFPPSTPHHPLWGGTRSNRNRTFSSPGLLTVTHFRPKIYTFKNIVFSGQASLFDHDLMSCSF